MQTLRSSRAASLLITPRVLDDEPCAVETINENEFKSLDDSYKDIYTTDDSSSEFEEISDAGKTKKRYRKSNKHQKSKKKKTDDVPLDFVVASTRSVLLKHLKDTISPQTPTTIDMSYEDYKRVFNANSCTSYEPRSKVRNSDSSTMFSINKEQFIAIFGDNEEYQTTTKDNIVTELIFPVVCCFMVNNNPTKYISNFKWYSIKVKSSRNGQPVSTFNGIQVRKTMRHALAMKRKKKY
ncbi:hypothetical protein AKO1_003658 [Acrasis kona]|uniref:PiggyBac transposable element-derived protein domain-containing protein n=1 Tax=Acrasis kona TaxID=1008807 RepID=A0AAW2YS46_9EUKA